MSKFKLPVDIFCLFRPYVLEPVVNTSHYHHLEHNEQDVGPSQQLSNPNITTYKRIPFRPRNRYVRYQV